MGGRLLDFLGQGLAAARPAAAGVPALIPTGAAAVYYAYDTGIFSFFDEDAVDWVELDIGSLSAIGFQNLSDVDWTTPPTDGQFFIWDNTAGKFVPADAPAEYTDTDADARVAAGIATHEAAGDPHPGYLTPAEGNAAYAPIAHVGGGGAEHADAVAAGASGFMTGADKSKLDGIAAGATNYTDELAQDAVGAMIADSDTIDLTYTDGTPELKAELKKRAINNQTDNYELVLADYWQYVRMDKATAVNLTVPANATVAFPVGTEIPIFAKGAGQVTVVAAGGVTINTPETLLLRKQYSTGLLVKVATDEWDLTGDLELV